MTKVHIKLLSETARIPRRSTSGSAGLDLFADIGKTLTIGVGHNVSVGTGVAIAIPHGYEGQVRGRSGLAFRQGLFANLGTIDSDYRGEICVLLSNHGYSPVTIEPGQRIAQLVIAPVVMDDLILNAELPDTDRGSNGFGSTGK